HHALAVVLVEDFAPDFKSFVRDSHRAFPVDASRIGSLVPACATGAAATSQSESARQIVMDPEERLSPDHRALLGFEPVPSDRPVDGEGPTQEVLQSRSQVRAESLSGLDAGTSAQAEGASV